VTVLARRSSLLLVFAVACFATALAISAPQASSASYTSCKAANGKPITSHANGAYGLGLYLRQLKVKGGPTCAGARNFVKLYYKCRTKPWNGSCSSVSGYSCSESRSHVTSITFDARVTCKKGSKRVFQKYQQFKYD